jgi:hypothetical protein
MKVFQLIQKLQEIDQDLEVAFSYNYGDRLRTAVASEVTRVSEEALVFSANHRMLKVLDGEPEKADGEVFQMVVLR